MIVASVNAAPSRPSVLQGQIALLNREIQCMIGKRDRINEAIHARREKMNRLQAQLVIEFGAPFPLAACG